MLLKSIADIAALGKFISLEIKKMFLLHTQKKTDDKSEKVSSKQDSFNNLLPRLGNEKLWDKISAEKKSLMEMLNEFLDFFKFQSFSLKIFWVKKDLRIKGAIIKLNF